MKTQKNNQGYTLIEVLIAMAIFAIGFLAVAGMQIKSINLNATARLQTEATTLAVDWLERLIALPQNHTDLDELNSPHRVTAGAYTIEWIVEDDVPINALKTIEIRVSAANPLAKPVSISFVKAPRS